MLPWRDGVILYLLPIFTFQHWGRALASKAPPTWVKQPPTGEIFFQAMPPGEVTLDCVAKVLMGDPALTYTWLKNGQRLKWDAKRMSMPQNSGTLTINPVLREDEGLYQCQANNSWGVASSNIVNIRETFLDAFPASDITNIKILEDDPHALYCTAPRSSPQATLHWQKQFENSPVLHEIKDDDGRLTLDSNGTLWFSYVVMNDKTVDFTYVCTAQIPGQQTLVVGHRVSMQVTKKRKQTRYRRPALQFASSDVQTSIQGSQVKLYCIYDGKPNPEVVWRKGNQHLIPHEYDDRLSLRSKGKILMINNVTTADEGNYICVANNSAGEAPPQSVFLDVQVLPYFTVEPTTVTARQGEKVEIRCEAAGDPMPTITWTKNGIYTPALSGQKVVTFHSAKVTDTGNFGCNASSEIGHVYKDIAINILDPDIHEDYYDSSHDYSTDSTVDSSTNIEHSTTERHMDTMDQDLTAVNVSSESVTVTWRSNGHDVNYEVTVTCEQSASSCNESLTNCPEPTRTFDTNGLNELTFPAKPFTEYKVKVTEIGHGGDTAMPFTVRAKEAVPRLPVMNLNQTLVPQESSIDVALTWEKPCSQSAPFSHYEVKLKESRGITEERVFRSTYLHQRITNLKPETNYMATVNPVYIVGSHQSHGLSSMIGFTTPEATSLRGKCALGVERKSKETAMVKIQRCVFLDISDIERWMLIVSRHPLTPTSNVGAPPEIPPWTGEFPEIYVASPVDWNPFMLGEENSHYSLGADKSGCKEKIWCNNVLQSDSDYFIMLRAVTSQGFVDSHVTHIRTVASANSKIILSIVLVLGFIIMCFIIFRFCREYVRNRRHGVAEITPVAHFKSSDPEKQVYIAISKPQDDDVMEKSPKVAHVSPEVKFQEDKEKLQSIDLGVIEEPTEGIRQTDGIDNQSFLKSDDDDVFESQKFTHPENKDQAQIPENNDDKSFLNGDDYDFQGQKVTEGQTKDIDDQPLMNEKGGDDFQGQTLSPPTVNDIENQIVVTEDAETLKDQESLVDDLQEENSPELLIQESENLGNILETAFD